MLTMQARWRSLAGLLLIAFAAAAPAASSAGAGGGATLQSVTFPSRRVASGFISLQGTLVLPDSELHGQRTQRSVSEGSYQPFFEIALQLAEVGVASLAFDKRSCTAAVHANCSNELCPAGAPRDGCVDYINLRVDDFVSDGGAAIDFLLSPAQSPLVRASDLVVLGHSQGVTTGLILAAQESSVSTVVLAMGGGRSIDEVLALQAEAQEPVVKEALEYWIAQPESPQRDANVAFLNASLLALDCTATYSVPQFALVSNGTIDPLGAPSLLCPSGVVLQQSVAFCPAACGTGICAPGLNTPDCLAQCNQGARTGACQLSLFWDSWFNLSLPATTDAALAILASPVRNVSLFILNSPTDLLVPPVTYDPLHAAALLAYANSAAALNVTQMDGLTHVMTDNDSPATHVSSRVLEWFAQLLGGSEADE